MSVLIITGNPVDGFAYTGPFDTSDEAIAYEHEFIDNGADWWVAPVTTPEVTP